MFVADEQFEQAIDGACSALQVDLLSFAEGFAQLSCSTNQFQRRIGLHLHRLLRLGQDGVRDLLLGGSSFRFDGRIDGGVDRVHGTTINKVAFGKYRSPKGVSREAFPRTDGECQLSAVTACPSDTAGRETVNSPSESHGIK
jgi:hypothetical protein